MMVGDRIRQVREDKQLSQGDIEKRTGLLRCYISRVENGHTVPAIETLEKIARALELPLYRLFYEGTVDPKPVMYKSPPANEKLFGKNKQEANFLKRFRGALSKLNDVDQRLIYFMAQKMARRKESE
jgi:transcriptional regulator with XRE-family HTH domain